MKRHSLTLFIVALLVVPIMLVGLSSCSKKAVKTEQPMKEQPKAMAPKTMDDEAKKKAEQERMKAEQDAKMKAEEEALKAKMAAMAKEAKAQSIAAMRRHFLNTYAHFDFDKYNIRPDAAFSLRDKADYMKMKGSEKMTVEIQGHCDERGTNAYNMALGDRRAKSAKAYMESLGIDASRMTTISYGEERPIDPGHNEEAWAMNRRAQFVITGE